MDGLIPAIINKKAGTAADAAKALAEVGGFEVHEVDPTEIRRVTLDLVAMKP
jgi:diacylglycerol kinase family enzyme